jgi:Tol biopolymer transport system component
MGAARRRGARARRVERDQNPQAAQGRPSTMAALRRSLVAHRASVLSLLLVTLFVTGPSLVGAARALLDDGGRPPDGLVFVRDDSLFRVGPGRGVQTSLVEMGDGETGNPAVSPDGAQLAFTHLAGTYGVSDWGANLYVLPLTEGGVAAGAPKLILRHDRPGDAVDSLAWSPDGRTLLLTYEEALFKGEAYQGTRSRLETLELATGRRRVIARDARDPAWSPGGDRIAYIRLTLDQTHMGVWTARSDGSDPSPVDDPARFTGAQTPAYSPDGARLVFAAVPRTGLGRARPDGDGLGAWLRPRAAEAHGVPWDLFAWTRGQPLKQLTQLGQDQPYVAWSPQGDRLALITDIGTYTLDPEGGDLRQLELEADPRGLAWLRP